MKTRAIGVIIAIIAVWILIVGGSIIKNFNEIAHGNQQLAGLEWTFLCDSAYGEYEDIEEIEGSNYFIGVGSGETEYHLIDETGKKVVGPYTNMEPLGDGYVRTEVEPTGVVIEDENGDNIRIVVSVLDKNGFQLSEENQASILEKYPDDGKKTPHSEETGTQQYSVIRYGAIIGIAGIRE